MANEVETVDRETGEVMSMTETAQPLAVQLAQAELNQAVVTARSFPREITRAVRNIMSLATLDDESAKECVYALPRSGKAIKGPSIRFAEIVASQWGNCHTASRIVSIDRFDKVVVAEGIFLDLETGMKRTAQIRRRIIDNKGRLYNDDMITMTGNAAASIAMREAILKGIPKAVWRQAYDRCEKVIAGDIKTLVQRREEAMKGFAAWGVKPEQVFAALDVGGLDDIGLDEIATISSIVRAVKAGEQKLEDYFPAKTDAAQAVEAAKGTAAKLGRIAEQGKAPDTNSAPTPNHGNSAGADTPDSRSGGTSAEESASSSADTPSDSSRDQDDSFPGDQPSGIDRARAAGRAARSKNMSRKSMAAEFKQDEQMLAAWAEGFDEGGQ